MIGKQVEIVKKLANNKRMVFQGLCYGKEPIQGGTRYMVKELKLVEPKTMGVMKVKKIITVNEDYKCKNNRSSAHL